MIECMGAYLAVRVLHHVPWAVHREGRHIHRFLVFLFWENILRQMRRRYERQLGESRKRERGSILRRSGVEDLLQRQRITRER